LKETALAGFVPLESLLGQRLVTVGIPTITEGAHDE